MFRPFAALGSDATDPRSSLRRQPEALRSRLSRFLRLTSVTPDGIDTAHWQTLDGQPLPPLKFATTKASEGGGYKDPKFVQLLTAYRKTATSLHSVNVPPTLAANDIVDGSRTDPVSVCHRFNRLARSHLLANRHYGRRRQFGLTVPLALRLSTARNFIVGIIRSRSEQPVLRVLARRIVTSMANDEVVRDWGNEMFVSPSMRQHWSPAQRKHPVTGSVSKSDPGVATIGSRYAIDPRLVPFPCGWRDIERVAMVFPSPVVPLTPTSRVVCSFAAWNCAKLRHRSSYRGRSGSGLLKQRPTQPFYPVGVL